MAERVNTVSDPSPTGSLRGAPLTLNVNDLYESSILELEAGRYSAAARGFEGTVSQREASGLNNTTEFVHVLRLLCACYFLLGDYEAALPAHEKQLAILQIL